MAEALIISENLNFKRIIPHYVLGIARNVISGKFGYLEAENLLIFSIREMPGRDYDFALNALFQYVDRYESEAARIAGTIREKCGPMIIAGVKPERIKLKAEKLDGNNILGADAIREILRDEWVKHKC